MIKQLIFGGACGCCCSQTSGYLKKSLKTLIIHTRDHVISGSRMVTAEGQGHPPINWNFEQTDLWDCKPSTLLRPLSWPQSSPVNLHWAALKHKFSWRTDWLLFSFMLKASILRCSGNFQFHFYWGCPHHLSVDYAGPRSKMVILVHSAPLADDSRISCWSWLEISPYWWQKPSAGILFGVHVPDLLTMSGLCTLLG